MQDLKIKGYCTFHPLKTAIVGDVFEFEQFNHLKNDKILSPLVTEKSTNLSIDQFQKKIF